MLRVAVLTGILVITSAGTPANAVHAQDVATIATFAGAGATSVVPQESQQVSSPLERIPVFSVRDMPLAEALARLGEQSNLTFAFSPTFIPADRRVTCECTNHTVSQILDRILDRTRLTYRLVGSHVLIEAAVQQPSVDVTLPSATNVARVDLASMPIRFDPPVARQGTVTGRVTDAQTLEPVPTAQVFIPGTQFGTISAADGTYRLQDIPAGSQTINVQRIGFQEASNTITIVSGSSVVLDFQLSREALALDEIIVTGTPGGTQRRALGHDVARLDAAEIVEASSPASVQNLLSGRTPGVNIALGSGEVGGGSQMRIRGISSLSLGSNPILYVDGVRVNNSAGGSGRSPGSSSQMRLNDFNPEDIASIEIIKGPAAATLYGTEASAGVIQIITKRGQLGAPTFDAQMRLGTNFLLDAVDKIPWSYFINDETGVLEKWHPIISEREAGYPEWLQNGPLREVQLQVRGGEDRLRYYASFNNSYEEGYVGWNNHGGTSGRVNLDAILTDNLDLSISTNLMTSDTRSPANPRPYTLAGSFYYGHPGRKALRGWYVATPEIEKQIENNTGIDRSTVSVQATHNPFSWFTQRLVFGHDRTHELNDLFIPSQPEGASHPILGAQGLGDLQRTVDRTSYLSAEYSGQANFAISESLGAETAIGFQYNRSEIDTDEMRAQNFAAPGLRSIDAAAITLAGGDWVSSSSVGLYVQQQLDWNNRVFLTAAIRGDDHSAFGANYDAALYPKFSAAWVLHEEPFWNVPLLNSMRVRAAWGQAGRQPEAFASISLYRPEAGPAGLPSLVPATIGNPDLGPEVGTEAEIGFDAGLLEDRVVTSFTYYDKSTKNALLQQPAASSTGFLASQWVNAGEITNRGVEVSVNVNAIQKRSFGWDVGLNYSYNQNRLVDMGSLTGSGRFIRNVEGYPINSVWMPIVVSADWEGDPLTGRAVNAMCLTPAGGTQLCDTTGASDIFYQGRGQDPTWIGSVNTALTLFNNLRLFANVDFKGGHMISSTQVHAPHFNMYNTYAINGDPANGIHPDPVVWWYSQNSNPAFSGSFAQPLGIFPGGFARLRDLSAEYSFPQALAERLGASRASLNIAGNNLWFLWQEEPAPYGRVVGDPEASDLDSQTFSMGGGNAVWLTPSRLSATLRVTF